MSKFYLINNIRVGSYRLYAGALIDDAFDSVANIRAAGGVLVPQSNGAVATAAALAQKLRKRGAPLLDMAEIMEAALSSTHDVFPKGADLGDADVSIKWSDGLRRVIPAATLTASRTVTYSTAAGADGRLPPAGARLTVTRKGVEAFTLLFVNGGVGAGTMATLVASKAGWFTGEFDGTNWEVVGSSAT